jgi:hypothetical protein
LNNEKKAFDACPFPPDGQPPSKTLTTNAIDLVDRVFNGWRNYLLLVSAMVLVLAYSLIMVPPPLIAGTITPSTWNKTVTTNTPPWETYDWIKVREPDHNYTEQMILDGNTTLEFINQTVNFNDIVLVKDNAKIVLRNSTLIVSDGASYNPENIYNEYVGMLFNDSARLEAYDSLILQKDLGTFGFNIGFIGSSSCYLENTSVVNGIISFDESSSLEARNSTMMRIYIDGSSSGKIYDSRVRFLLQYKYWRTHWESPLKNINSSVFLSNSKLDAIMITVVNSTNCMVKSPIGIQEDWNIYKALRMEGKTMNLTLKRSEITLPLYIYSINSVLNASDTQVDTLIASNSRVNLTDTQVRDLSIYTNSSVNINDSNINSLSTGSYFVYEEFDGYRPTSNLHQDLVITDSKIKSMDIGSNTRFVFDNVYVDEASVEGNTEASLSGDWMCEAFTSNPYTNPGSEYQPFSVTQTFKVVAQGEKRMIPGVNLALMDKDGKQVWSGVTDKNGEASFNLTFCQFYPLYEPYQYVTNYKDIWNLTGSYNGETKTSQVVFLKSGSPITFTYATDAYTLPIDNRNLIYLSVAVILLLTLLKIGSYL